jgi:hypothetical protein
MSVENRQLSKVRAEVGEPIEQGTLGLNSEGLGEASLV